MIDESEAEFRERIRKQDFLGQRDLMRLHAIVKRDDRRTSPFSVIACWLAVVALAVAMVMLPVLFAAYSSW